MANAVTTNKSITRPCTCKHEVQDQLYGKGIRVWNGCREGFRCTVCGEKKL